MLKLARLFEGEKMLTEEQKANRHKGIGGSDVAIIMGLSNYMTPVQLWLQKRGELVLEDTQSPQAYWGTQLESIIRNEFANRHNVAVEQPDTVVNDDYSYMRGNIDGFIPTWNAVLEIKTANQFLSHEWGQEGREIPLRYLVQLAYYCMLTNASKGICVVLIGGQDYREYTYERDEFLEADILSACDDFWRCVQDGIQPVAQYSDMKYLHKALPDKSVVWLAEHQDVLQQLQTIKAQHKKLDEREEAAKLIIMDYMRDAEYLTDDDGKVVASWKANKRGRTFLIKGQ